MRCDACGRVIKENSNEGLCDPCFMDEKNVRDEAQAERSYWSDDEDDE